MRQDYGECERRVLLSEGGYTNDPRDPGGPTNWGITLRDARLYWKPDATAEDVRAMPRSVADEIYKGKYWDALGCDALPPGVDYTAFDYGVNSGVGRASRVLRAYSAQGFSPLELVDAINDERLRFLQSLPTWDHFGTGWSRRVASVKAFSEHLAQGAVGMAPTHPVDPNGNAKGYGPDAVPIPAPRPLDIPQTVNVGPQSGPVVRSDDTPATPIAPLPDPAPRAPNRLAPWLGLGLGGSGTLDWLHQANEYGSEISMAKFNLEDLNASGAFFWVLDHPMVLVPFIVVAAGIYVWREHVKYAKLIAAVKK